MPDAPLAVVPTALLTMPTLSHVACTTHAMGVGVGTCACAHVAHHTLYAFARVSVGTQHTVRKG